MMPAQPTTEQFFSAGNALGFIDDLKEARADQSKTGLDRFGLSFLFVIRSHRRPLRIVEYSYVQCVPDVTFGEFILRPNVNHR